jgi:hypothetical protein
MLSWMRHSLVSFVLEESMDRTAHCRSQSGGPYTFPIYRGVLASQWLDFRSEFEPIFTF